MSCRRPSPQPSHEATRLRSELEALKQQSAVVEVADALAENTLSGTEGLVGAPGGVTDAVAMFDQLTPTEQAAGSLGVHPEAWRPIKFMNAAHYDQLRKSNALDDHLARRIEAFKTVAASS